jgi:hypothetical protein
MVSRVAIGDLLSGQISGNGANPTSSPTQLGCVRLAPLLPHLAQRTERRIMSLLASCPHRMIKGVSAMGARCRHVVFKQFTHSQHACLRMSASVGRDGAGGLRIRPRWQACELW